MIADKIMTLEACRYDNLPRHSKVFNTNEIEYHLWIYLNPQEVRDAVFLEAHEIGEGTDGSAVSDKVFERKSQCWIRAVTEHLNTFPGKHTYKLMMVDRYTDTDFSLYISYYVQDDNPDKPYVYMKPDGASTPVDPDDPEDPANVDEITS